jgi:hypothetical protein
MTWISKILAKYPSASDNFAFKDEGERERYYEFIGTALPKPTERFSYVKLAKILFQAVLIFAAWLGVILAFVLYNKF